MYLQSALMMAVLLGDGVSLSALMMAVLLGDDVSLSALMVAVLLGGDYVSSVGVDDGDDDLF